MGAIRAMISLFTVIPVNTTMVDYEDLSRRFWLLPLIGALFGLLASLSFLLLSHVFSTLLAAVVVVMLMQAFNRFLHFDGLMDLGDGLVAHGDQEKKLGALKDSSIGAGGVAFALFFILLAISALSSLPTGSGLELIILVPFAMELLGRNAMLACAALGTPRPGLGSKFVTNTKARAIVPSIILSTFIVMVAWILIRFVFPTGCLDPYVSIVPFLDWIWMLILTLVLVLVSTVVGAIMARVGKNSFGCVNGDVIGATNEITRPLIIMVMVLLLVVP